MNEQKLEKKLKEDAKDVQLKDFSLVWEQIKDRVQEPPKKRGLRFHWKTVLVTAAACAVIACPFVAIPFLDESDSVYTSDSLEYENVEKEEFEAELENVDFQIVDISNYYVDDYYLYKTETDEVKGGKLNLVDDLNNSTWLLSVRFYEQTVRLNDATVSYDLTYTVGTAFVEYRVKEAYPSDSMYIYDVKANYNGVNYLMEYTCATDDITPFLQEFFS